jgi:hypothetical protein
MTRTTVRTALTALIVACGACASACRAAAIYFVDYNFESTPGGGGRDRFSLHRANLDGTGRVEIVHDMGPQPQYASMAVFEGVVYWRDFFNLSRAATTGGTLLGPTEPPNGQVAAAIYDRAIDSAGVHTYFPGRDEGTAAVRDILRGDFEYENPVTLVPTRDFSPNVSIAVDEAGAKIYWAGAWGGDATGLVQRANLADGSEVQTLLEGFAEDDFPLDLALDPAAGKLYLANDSLHKIQRANLDGSDLEDLISGVSPFAMAIERTVPESSCLFLLLAPILARGRTRRTVFFARATLCKGTTPRTVSAVSSEHPRGRRQGCGAIVPCTSQPTSVPSDSATTWRTTTITFASVSTSWGTRPASSRAWSG